MKLVSNTLRNTIRNDHILEARPRLIAEWNLNRYTTPEVTNTPSEEEEGYDPELFPIESIVEPLRPAGGIVKARVGKAKLQASSPLPPATRYVVSSENDTYKYWTSPFPSSTSGTPAAISGVDVVVDYKRPVRINRIRLNFEEHDCLPLGMQLFVRTTAAGAWEEITPSSLSVPADGNFEFFYDGEWSQTRFDTTNSDVVIHALRVKVNSVDKTNSYLSIVEIAGLLEKDLTPYFMSHSSTMDSGNSNDLLPVGSVSSNIGDITLFNALVDENDPSKGLLFSNDNPHSPLAGLIDAGALFTFGYVYDTPSGTEYVQEFKMYADDAWSAGQESSLTVSLTDSARDLQNITCPPLLFENKTAVEIAWRILDAVGFTDYDVQTNSAAGTPTIPYFWTEGTETVWEVLQGLAEAAQVAIWFNGYGKLQIRSRDALFKNSSPVWTIDGESALNPADLKELTPEVAHKANVVNVKYTKPFIKQNGYGGQIREIVWQPSGDTILGSSDLVQSFPASATPPAVLRISATDVASWEYSGYISVQGEIMRYDAKAYGAVLKGNTTKTYHWVSNHEEYTELINKRDPEHLSSSGFAGTLRIVERGVFNTPIKDHNLFSVDSWRVVRVRKQTNASSPTTDLVRRGSKKIKDGVQFDFKRLDGDANAKGGVFELAANKAYESVGHLLLATKGAPAIDIPPRHYGTRIKLSSVGSGTTPRGGLHIFGSANNDRGYYIQLMPSANTTKNTKEVVIFRRNQNGTYTRMGSKTGYSQAILLNQWYTMDVSASRQSNGNDTILVYINGRQVARAVIPAAETPPYGGRVGMFVRGGTRAQFEYIYALDSASPLGTFDEADEDRTFFDFVAGGYVSDPLWKNYFYRSTGPNKFKRKMNKKYKEYRKISMFEEFGPVVHEMQRFNVDLDKSPVLSPTFVSTNQAGISIINFEADHRSADFYAVNTSRENALLNGSMKVAGGTSNQKMAVLGYLVEFKEAENVTVRNEQAVRTFGESVLDIESKWIQSKSMAESMGKWITDHWASAKSTYTATLFGNPLLEVGDIVDVNYPVSGLTRGTNKFVILEVVNTWDNGLSTVVKLRQIA